MKFVFFVFFGNVNLFQKIKMIRCEMNQSKVPDTRSSDTGRSIADRNRRKFDSILDGGISWKIGRRCCHRCCCFGPGTEGSTDGLAFARWRRPGRRPSSCTLRASIAPPRCGTGTWRTGSRAMSTRHRSRAILLFGCCSLSFNQQWIDHVYFVIEFIMADKWGGRWWKGFYRESSWGCWTDSGTRNRPACWRSGYRRDTFPILRHIRPHLHIQQGGEGRRGSISVHAHITLLISSLVSLLVSWFSATV